MHDSERYRHNAENCLQAARKTREPHCRRLYLLMAQSWLSLADQDDATDRIHTLWGIIACPVSGDGVILPFRAPGPFH
jgi:hypothetical protein